MDVKTRNLLLVIGGIAVVGGVVYAVTRDEDEKPLKLSGGLTATPSPRTASVDLSRVRFPKQADIDLSGVEFPSETPPADEQLPDRVPNVSGDERGWNRERWIKVMTTGGGEWAQGLVTGRALGDLGVSWMTFAPMWNELVDKLASGELERTAELEHVYGYLDEDAEKPSAFVSDYTILAAAKLDYLNALEIARDYVGPETWKALT